MKILLPVDGSKFSDAAIDELRRRPWPQGTEVKVITAVEIPVIVGMEPWAAAPIYFEQMEGAARDSARLVVENAVTQLRSIEPSLRIDAAIIEGPPREVIVDEAEKWGADLIVMGSRGLGAWGRLLLGSVSNAVVHHAMCSVEIVRRPQAQAKKK